MTLIGALGLSGIVALMTVAAATDAAVFLAFIEGVLAPALKRRPEAVLVLDNLSTHAPAALYEAFAPAEARRLCDRIEWHYTPKHGSWLNVAEVELAALSRQCLGRRIGTKAELQRQVGAWEEERNQRFVETKWRFTTADARIKLHRLYPSIQE